MFSLSGLGLGHHPDETLAGQDNSGKQTKASTPCCSLCQDPGSRVPFPKEWGENGGREREREWMRRVLCCHRLEESSVFHAVPLCSLSVSHARSSSAYISLFLFRPLSFCITPSLSLLWISSGLTFPAGSLAYHSVLLIAFSGEPAGL